MIDLDQASGPSLPQRESDASERCFTKAGTPENGRMPRPLSWTGMTGLHLQFSTCSA